MAFRIKHLFVNPKSDGVDTTITRPTDWNANHVIEMNAGKIMGRDSSGGGNAQELPLSFNTDGDPDFNTATGALGVPTGTTSERIASPRDGHFRFNTTLAGFEGRIAGAWNQLLSSVITATVSFVGAALNEAARVDVASAATTDIGDVASNYVRITGNVTITRLGTVDDGARRHVLFADTLTLTHDSSFLVLPNDGDDIVTAAGDMATFLSSGTNHWRCEKYSRANGQSVAVPARGYDSYTSTTALTVRIPADNSIPTVSEGTEIMSVEITPRSATSRVAVMAKVPIGVGSGISGIACAALYRNGGSAAIDAAFVRIVDGIGLYPAVIYFEHVPGAATAQEYTIRVGGATFDVFVNADISGRLGGGVSRASMKVEEIFA